MNGVIENDSRRTELIRCLICPVEPSIKELVEQLPPDLQQEVKDFAEFLLRKRVTKKEGELRLEWRGALRDLRDKYTSVELQHKALQWWGD